MTTSNKQPGAARSAIAQNTENPYLQFLDDDLAADNPYAQFVEEERKRQEVVDFTENLSRVDSLQRQPEWMTHHMDQQPRERTWGDVASDTGRGLMKGLAGVADAAMHTGEFLDDAVPLGGLTWEDGHILPSYKTPGEYQALKEQGMAVPTDATGGAMGHWEQGKSRAIQQDAQYVAEADGFADTFKRVAERPRVIGNAIADSLGYMVPGAMAANRAKAAGLGLKGMAAATAGAGAVTEGGAARSQAVGEVMDMPLGELLEHSPDFKSMVDSGVAPDIARQRVAADAGFTAQAITMPVSFLASAITGAAKAEADFFTGQGAKEFFTGLFRQAGEEMTQEAGSQFGINVGVAENADERRNYTDNLGNAAAMGAIMGPAQQAGMTGIDLAGSRLLGGRRGYGSDHDDGVDQPQNGEQLMDDGVESDLAAALGEPRQLGHNPQRMIVLPDGTTAWEGELDRNMFPPSAASQHPGFARLNETPEQIEAALGEPVDVDAELQSLMDELAQLESIAAQVTPMAPPGANPFDQFDEDAQPAGLFDGIRQARQQQQEAARAAQAQWDERANHVLQHEDDERGFMGQVARLQEQANYAQEPVARDSLPADFYPPDPAPVRAPVAQPRIEAPLPAGLDDKRLLRPEYRGTLERMAGELVKGGGVGYVRDEHDRITGRTPSLNPNWFKAVGENPDTAMSVADTQAAITKALAGERLGVRQARVVGAALDEISGERGSYARELRAMRENARADRRKAFEDWLGATSAPVDAEFEAEVWPDSPGETYNETDYLPESTMESRAISELAETANSFGADWRDIDSALEAGDIEAQTKALTQLIWNARNEHRKATKQPEQPATGAQSGSGAGASTIEALEAKPPHQAQSAAEVIDFAATEAATSPDNSLPEPTEAQKEAGNYKKAHVKIQGLDIAIENPRGSTRSGTDKDGKSWSVTMHNHYGYLKRTEGADGDHVDVFIGPNPDSDKVFIVDQANADGSFDEHKVLLGFDSKLKARSGYKSNYSSGWKVGPITSMSMDEFKAWLNSGDTQKPLSDHFADSGKMVNQIEDKLEMVNVNDKNSDGRIWERRSPRSWKSNDGQIIADYSMTNGGKKQKMFMVFSDQKAFDAGSNYATGESLAEAKGLANSENEDFRASVSKARVAEPGPNVEPDKQEATTETIQDLGEKIGGARKDSVVKTSKKTRLNANESSAPAWSRRYEVAQVVDMPGRIGGTKDAGKWVILDKQKSSGLGSRRAISQTFDSEHEAQEAIAFVALSRNHRALLNRGGMYEIWRIIGDRKRVKVVDREFASRDEAMLHMMANAESIIETNTTFGEADLPVPPDRQRTGVDRRTGNVGGQDFMDTFGFRGVEFGNWNNQDERQALLNDAYDGLLDLAEILGIPPKAISLSGDLALAFGARGQGLSSAKAHYERSRAVINLTKENGAGSLAHEWFHALDHYFGRQDGKASSEWEIGADGTRSLKVKGVKGRADDYASHGFRVFNSGVRPEVREAYEALIKTLFSKAETYVEDTRKVDDFVGRAREELAGRLGDLRNELAREKDQKFYKRHNKPASTEQLAEFDSIAQGLLDGQGLNTVSVQIEGSRASFPYRLSNDSLEAISAIYKAVRGRTGFGATNGNGVLDSLRRSMKRYAERLTQLSEAARGDEKVRRVPTEFSMNARELDQGRGTDYWSTPHEMVARAFQGYVEDKIAEQGNVSRFLNYGPENFGIPTPWGFVRPFPAGKERAAINKAFDKFLEVLDHKETDSGIALFSISRQKSASGLTQEATQAIADRIRKAWKNPYIKIKAVADIDGFPDEQREAIQKHNQENPGKPVSAKALFHNGDIYINASAVHSEADVEQAIFHEAHGHYGLRALFGKETGTAMGRLYLAMGGERGMLEAAKRHKVDLSEYQKLYRNEPAAKRIEHLMNELLAHIAQDNRPGIKRRLQELWGAIRTWLRAHGFISLSEFSDSELMALLKRTREAATDLKLKGGSIAKVLLDGALVDSAAGTPAPAFSLSGLPPKTRKVIGNDPLLAAWTLLAQNDEAFQLPISERKTLEEIFDEIVPGVKIRRAPEFDDNGAQVWAVNPKKDTLALVFQKGKSVWIDVADYSTGQGGRQIYNAVANYAHNTGRTFIGDPAGLSDEAMARRLENMISSALKFGTTDHLWPHERQEQGGAGVPPIKWKAGDDAHNLKEMINASYQSVLNQFPEIADLRYNPVNDQIESVKDGKVYSPGAIKEIAARKRDSGIAGGQPVTAGGKTLERAVLTHTVSRGTRQEQFNVLAALSNKRSERLAGILYSLAPDTEPETRPSGGFSVSGVEKDALDKLGLKPAARSSIIQRITAITTRDIKNLKTAAAQRAYEGIFDGLIGIKRAEEAAGVGIGSGDYVQSGYVGAVLATGTADVMHHILEFGAVHWNAGILQPVEGTQGLLQILGDLGTDMRDWLAWMGANRAAELMKQGRENNLTKEDITALFRRANGKLDKFKKAKAEYNKLNKAMLDVAEGAGLIDPDARKEWESEWYIPFYRRTDDVDLGITAPRTKRGLSHQTSGIKALKGGDLATNNLLENILANWLKLADSSVKNGALLKTVDNLKGTEFLQDETLHWSKVQVPRAQVVKRIKQDRTYLEWWAEQLGLDAAADALEVAHEINKLSNEGFEEMWVMAAPTDPEIIRVKRDGKNEYYRVADPALLRAVTHLGHHGFNDPVMRGMRWFKRLLTMGVTSSPDFILRNFIRDVVHAWTINPDGMVLGSDAVKGIAGAFKEDADYRALVASGAAFQGGYVHGADPQASAQLVERAVYRRGLKDIDPDSVLSTPEKLWEVIQKGWQTYRGWGDKVENTNRLATFKRAIKAGKPMAQAVYEAKDLMDYSRRGNFAAMMMLTDMIPFLNARVQGFGKLGRAIAENPKTVAIRAGMIASVSVVLAMLNADDERYEELPDWEKDAYWHFFIGDDHWRVPKPFEIGIVAGTFPERIALNLVGAQENEKLAWTLRHNMLHTFGFSGPYGLPFPQALQPLVESASNRSFYFDAPIEGMADEGKLPEARYDANTSDTMVKLGQWIGMSPKKLQHVFEGYTGTMGSYVLGVVDVATRMASSDPAKPARKVEDLPVVKAVYRGDSPKTNRYVAQLYDDLGQAEEAYKTIRAYRGEGKDSLADKVLEKHRSKLEALGMYRKARANMSQIRKAILDTQNDRSISPEEKRRKIDELIRMRNELAKEVVRAASSKD